MEKIIKFKNIPTAIFCTSDLISIGAMYAIRKEGLIIPDDISIISGVVHLLFSYFLWDLLLVITRFQLILLTKMKQSALYF